MADIDLQQLHNLESDSRADGKHWLSAGLTHIGRVRPVNEDAFLQADSLRLWVIADGMGGHSRGDYASKAVIKTFEQFCWQDRLAASVKQLEQQLAACNEQCRTAFRGKRIGSTVAALFVYGHHCFFLWAGDSRIYRLRQGQLQQMTEDHSLAQEKCARGELTPEQAAIHPSANVLTRAVGVHSTLQLDLRHAAFEPGDRYLICSDGLYNGVSIADMHTRLALGSVDDAAASLLDRALDNGGRDNISVIVVDTEQG
ncbi:PP2C family protein-serine/threonine phosphatase [Agaribacterium haliotis]|uniref:PP2C family protein-serine/threonine phosphatase n=1 Tax=Agaribacterium haliotis TaxID=2013869 RepID=UPI000BB53B97|nr:protein phosphatase 2C domain-containing protein [Agaribacterium haliotis]